MPTTPMHSNVDNESPSTSRGAVLQGETQPHSSGTEAPIEIQEFAKDALDVGTGRAKAKLSSTNKNETLDSLELNFSKPQTARDRERLDAGKQALRELLKERKIKKKNKTSCFSLIRLYLTIIAALLISGGLMVLIFLVPMTIDPALATLNYEIEEEPAICLTMYVNNATGPDKWCSCRNGCTNDYFRCQQIIVAYRKRFLELDEDLLSGFNKTAFLENRDLPHDENVVDKDIDVDKISKKGRNCLRRDWVFNQNCWDKLNASLLVNVKGCGYPPQADCPIFLKSYNVTGRRFICYFSKVDNSLAIVNYNPKKPWHDLYLSLGWTCGAQIVGSAIIFLLHFPFRKTWLSFLNTLKKRKKKLPAQAPRPTAFKNNKVRQPVFQRDWYDVHT